MRIVVHLTPEATAAARGPRRQGAKRAVLAWLDRPVTPMHPGTTDATLAPFCLIEIEDPTKVPGLLERLLADPDVDGAYVKPEDELPM